MTPACNPATLRADPCVGGCGRQLHTAPPSRRSLPRGICDKGHPIHDAKGLCPRCRSRERRADRGTPAKPVAPQTPPPRVECLCDEGQPCTCEAAA